MNPELTGALAEIWQAELLLATADPNADYLELDGSSLTAVRLVRRIADELDVYVPIGALFDYPTPAGLAAALAAGHDTKERP